MIQIVIDIVIYGTLFVSILCLGFLFLFAKAYNARR